MITNDPKCVKLYIIRLIRSLIELKPFYFKSPGLSMKNLTSFAETSRFRKKSNHLNINILRDESFDSSINSDKAPGSRFHLVKFKAPPSHLKAQDRGQTIALVLG